MSLPHDSWADVYDEAYEHTFGETYAQLTELTLQVLREYVSPPASILDIGAGTGRLAMPLAAEGYRLTAVEPSEGMRRQIERKRGSLPITLLSCAVQDLPEEETHDLALCVFTVLSYLLDEVALEGAARALGRSVRPGGLLLLDVASREAFRGVSAPGYPLSRQVEVTAQTPDLYRYEEHITLASPEGSRVFTDAFSIRAWSVPSVREAMHSAGFSLAEDLTDRFRGTGATYLLLRRG